MVSCLSGKINAAAVVAVVCVVVVVAVVVVVEGVVVAVAVGVAVVVVGVVVVVGATASRQLLFRSVWPSRSDAFELNHKNYDQCISRHSWRRWDPDTMKILAEGYQT